ncbi:DUF2637 domain-containing protein [Actinoplanes sp. NPDC051851]|uniref:DUF2637 domain-containing protein n=1 Tax=Actinoplanes sp. NPDC051851 TaxID=3154753 RepID=UPI00343F945B
MSRVDTAIRAAAGVTVIGLAGIAGAISYSHMAELAHAHGEIGWRAHMFPLSVDGIEIVSSLVLLADKRAGRRSGMLPWAALIAGTGASFSANFAVGGNDWIGRAVSGWPAFALLIAVKLLFGLLEPSPPRPAESAVSATGSGTVVPQAADGPGPAIGDGDGLGTVPVDSEDGGDGGARPPAEPAAGTPMELTDPEAMVLLPAARAALRTLTGEGKPMTREALARQMRADGHPASNARMSVLLRVLTSETRSGQR